eukprot:5477460-Prymnesium_polylepis.1
MCSTFLAVSRTESTIARYPLRSNLKLHRSWNGGLPPDRLPVSFHIKPQWLSSYEGTNLAVFTEVVHILGARLLAAAAAVGLGVAGRARRPCLLYTSDAADDM